MNTITIGNTKRPHVRLQAGALQPVRVVASVGLSPESPDLETEYAKAQVAVECGADIVNDDSIVEPQGTRLLEHLLATMEVPVNTEPVFDTVASAANAGSPFGFSVRDVVSTAEKHARMGIDIMTIHLAYSLKLAKAAARSNRIIPVTSRGGALITAYMCRSSSENPYRVALDEVLGIMAEYGVTLSLGTVLRPASICDGLDDLFMAELQEQTQFIEAASNRGVPVMVEGPGHVSLDQIEKCVRLMKETTGGALIRLLGPTTCDCCPGQDHIVGCIGGAVAAMSGCDFLTCTTRSEHVGLPLLEHVKEAVTAFRVAAYVGADGRKAGYRKDRDISDARRRCDWQAMWRSSLYPQEAAMLGSKLNPQQKGGCTICGRFCPLLLAEGNNKRLCRDIEEQIS